jgi:glutaredoxin 3
VGGFAAQGLNGPYGPSFARISGMELKIVVYSKSACPQCESAKMVLKSKSLAFEEIKIDGEAERMAFFEKCGPSVRQMPQIFINDQRVGGFAGLQAALVQLGL